MNRREFLTTASALTGYSLLVKVDGLAAPTAFPTREQISRQFDVIAPPNPQDRALPNEPHMTLVDLHCDVFIAGGGPAGVCAALAAARHGAKVVLVQDRSRLGGNSSSEVKMHIVGANCHGGRPGWREGGLIEELRLEDAVNNPQRSWELWDLLLYDKIKTEPNIVLLLDTVLFAARTDQRKIVQVAARCDKTEHLYHITAKIYIDSTGDSRLALETGAQIRHGRETRDEFGESLALAQPDRQTLGSSILFTARDYEQPMPFKPPAWARKVTKEQLRFRPIDSWEYGYWWIEWGGQIDTIRDNERIRFELLSIVTGVWDYIKNSGAHPSSANWALDWIGMMPGKRESRRILGDYILTQGDLEGSKPSFDDAVALGGWPLDDHPPSGFDAFEQKPFTSIRTKEVYNIPLRSLYSRDLDNLMMAGRNISASHVAFSSTRVMATCAVLGQAAGTAAAFCTRYNLAPRQLYQDKSPLRHLQQTLLRDDQSIKGLQNEDPLDLARSAKVTASHSHDLAKPENLINGFVRDLGNEWRNRWGARLDLAPDPDQPLPSRTWLQLSWEQPKSIQEIQITFDTGFHRELTLSSSDAVNRGIIRAPQPETVRDYTIVYLDSEGSHTIVEIRGNYQRLRRHCFPPIHPHSIRIYIEATNGDPIARIYEVRCYG